VGEIDEESGEEAMTRTLSKKFDKETWMEILAWKLDRELDEEAWLGSLETANEKIGTILFNDLNYANKICLDIQKTKG
jgi:hypothetical protein